MSLVVMKKNLASSMSLCSKVETMLLEAVGDAGTVEAVLQLTHVVVVEWRTVNRVGHGASALTSNHVSS